MAAAWAMVSWLDLAIAAILVSAVAAWIAMRRRRARARDAEWFAASARTIGVVERFRVWPATFESSSPTYAPIIVYRAADGHLCQIAGPSSSFEEPPIGTEFEVAYQLDAPATARIANLPEPWSPVQSLSGRAIVLALAWLAVALATAALRALFGGG